MDFSVCEALSVSHIFLVIPFTELIFEEGEMSSILPEYFTTFFICFSLTLFFLMEAIKFIGATELEN
jgi:hypothetical protein